MFHAAIYHGPLTVVFGFARVRGMLLSYYVLGPIKKVQLI